MIRRFPYLMGKRRFHYPAPNSIRSTVEDHPGGFSENPKTRRRRIRLTGREPMTSTALVSPSQPRQSVFSFLSQMGPAWIISAVAAGPATMASVAMAGGLYGYQVLWVVVLSALLASVVQFMAAKVGIIGQRGIISTVESVWGNTLAWILTVDAVAATWLAAAVLLKALVETTVLITNLPGPWWPFVYVVLIFFLVGLGGYRALEMACKILVALVVLCFVVTVIKVGPDPVSMIKGLVPRFPGGPEGALMMAGIMGGAVHITIIGMHTYNVNARRWGADKMGLARLDTFLSMFVAFGLYSVAIYLAGAVVLHPDGIRIKTALDLAGTLTPVLGPYAGAVLLAGLFGAVFSTITPTYLAAGYFLADKLGWDLTVRDNRFRALVGLGLVVSLLGPLYKGGFLTMLVVMLALGLCGTPLIILLLLLLLNKKSWAGEFRNGWLLNVLGGLALVITTFLAVRFLWAKFL
jgi:manganese transport protein